ncbi:MAG: hypothetical protein AAF581_23740 [Planctomycetota bacterium]
MVKNPPLLADRQRGAVLLLALLMMTALTALGFVYLEQSTAYLTSVGLAENRLQARALGDVAIELGQQQLVDNPGFTGQIGPNSIGNGYYQINVTAIGDDRHLVVEGGSGAISRRSETRLTVAAASGGQPDTQIWVSNIKLHSKGHLVWDGPLVYETSVQVGGNCSATGSSTQDVAPALGFDPSQFQAAASIVYNSSHTYDDSDSGLVFVDGDLTINAECNFSGTYFVTGDINVSGNAAITLQNATQKAVLISQGGIFFAGVGGAINVTGSVYAVGEIAVDTCDSFNHSNGRVYTQGQLRVKKTTATFNGGTSSAVTDDEDIAGITLPGDGGTTTVRQLWQRPYRD